MVFVGRFGGVIILSILIFPALQNRRKLNTPKTFYQDGVEYVTWVRGYANGSDGPDTNPQVVTSKEATNLKIYIYIYNMSYAEGAFTTDTKVNLSYFNYLGVDTSLHTSRFPDRSACYLVLSSDKTGDISVYDYRWQHLQGIADGPLDYRSYNTYDIRNITGWYYIRLHLSVTGYKGVIDSELKIHKVIGLINI